MNNPRWRELFQKKLRYALGGGLATGVDYVIYFLLYKQGVLPVYAQVVAYIISVQFNFLFQRAFVFEQQRSTAVVYWWSMAVSGGGLVLSAGLIYIFNLFPFFQTYQILAKLGTTGILFFYNFYAKRYVFERRVW
ncbi:MAG: GtrA family protein [Bacteroidota bacterium]